MAYRFDPRGDLPVPYMQNTSHYHRPDSTFLPKNYERRSGHYDRPASYPKKKPCYDWIFSSASNVHVAVDRSSFKHYTSFKSYILTVADQRQISVKGIGTVELKIRRRSGSKESHKILLENVLHIPGWLCNIVSDVHFTPQSQFEHEWTDFGVSFYQKTDNKWKPWGYTETFCGLDKLVLSRNLQGRSPMLEDKDREVFSISINWPQGQRNEWEKQVAEEARKEAEIHEMRMKLQAEKKELERLRRESKSGSPGALNNLVNLKKSLPDLKSISTTPSKVLKEADPNTSKVTKRAASVQSGAMRTSTSKATFLEALPWRRSWAHEAPRS